LRNTFLAIAVGLSTLAFDSVALSAQEPMLIASSDTAPEAPTASITAPATVSTPPHALTERWLDLTAFSHSERYRNAFATGGQHDFDNAQQRSLIAGAIKLDADGRYRIGFRASSGRYFNWAYASYTGKTFGDRTAYDPQFAAHFFTPAETGVFLQGLFADTAGFNNLTGLQSNGWQFYMRELYLSATPLKPVTVEFGSFGIERGYSTEITTFDEDGYLSGERIRIHDPKHLFFDEIGYTNAFFGDISTVNLFARGSSLKHANYHQLFANKKVNKRLAFSGEYTRQSGIDTLREAAVVQTGGSKLVDSARIEVYERLNSHTFAGIANSPIGPIPDITINGASGFAVTLEKKLGRLSGNVGFATVDSDYGVYANSRFFQAVGFTLNGDTYGMGNRPFAHASFRIAPGVSAFGFYTHEVGGTRVLTLNQQGYNAGMNFDFKAIINQEKKVF
jgi:hypothetical protein